MSRNIIVRDAHGMPVMFSAKPKATPKPPPPRQVTELGGELTAVLTTGEAAAVLGLDAITARELLAAADAAAVLAWKRADVESLRERLPQLFASGHIKRVDPETT